MDDKLSKKFDESAKKLLINSQKIALSEGHRGMGTEHLLMAILALTGTLSNKILKSYAISIEHVKLALTLDIISDIPSEGLSTEFKRSITSAGKIAQEFGHPLIDSEHLLMGMMIEKTTAKEILKKLKINPTEIIDRIDSELNTDLNDLEPLNFDPEKEFPDFFSPKLNQQNKNTSKKIFENFTSDLTEAAKNGELDPIIGREGEIKRAIQILSRRTKNNPVLIGEPGVGKTAIVEGLAQKIHEGNVPKSLKNKKLLNLDLAAIVAGTMYRGQFEERIKKIIEEISNKDIIIFIDELHTIVGAGAVEGSIDAANILKPALQKGHIKLIGATTTDEFRKFIEKDAALERRFQQVLVEEPDEDQTLKILKGIRKKYEKFHNVQITDKALSAAVTLSKKYIHDRFLPDKAIDLIDEASAAKNLDSERDQIRKIQTLEKEIKKASKVKDKDIGTGDFISATKSKEELLKLEKDLSILINSGENCLMQVVDEENIAEAISEYTKIPLSKIVKNEQKKLLNLEEKLKTKIIGQDEAITQISKTIRRARAKINDPKRPIGSFIFLGPTGVGKTELGKVLASEVYGRESSLIKIDMSEFMERHNISRLVGAPPGYVGYDESGKLTEQVRRNPYSIILFDEIEKAHPEFYNLMLQILEDGYLSDSKGRRVSFRNTIIIMTSNIGLSDLTQAAIGFKSDSSKSDQYEAIKNQVLEKLKHHFKPEFLNRLDHTIVFKPLDKESIRKIVDIQFIELEKRLLEQGYYFKASEKAKDYISQISFEPKFGARPIRRNIADLIESQLSDIIISSDPEDIELIFCDLIDNELKIKIRKLEHARG
ncbi:MAG: ATP-dependent Clp protease ATP-binding subunit [Patescibacteria group bacterium]